MQQRQGSALRVAVLDKAAEPVAVPTFLLRLEPRHQAFWGNFADLFGGRRQPPLRLLSWPAAPWPDVFVPTRWPWRALSESAVLHLGVIAALLWLVPFLPHRELTVEHATFQKEDLIYYSPSEYLPPLDTGSAHVSQPQKGEPAYAPQPIISVPPEADNHTQTIVTPPAIKLDHDVALPNIVAWSPTPVAVPMAAYIAAKGLHYAVELPVDAPLSWKTDAKAVQRLVGDIHDCEAVRQMIVDLSGTGEILAALEDRRSQKLDKFQKLWQEHFALRSSL